MASLRSRALKRVGAITTPGSVSSSLAEGWWAAPFIGSAGRASERDSRRACVYCDAMLTLGRCGARESSSHEPRAARERPPYVAGEK